MKTNLFKRKDVPGDEGPHPRREPRFTGDIGVAALDAIFRDCDDFATRAVFLGGDESAEVTVAFIDGIVSGDSVGKDVIQPLTNKLRFGGMTAGQKAAQLILHGGIYSYTANSRDNLDDLVNDLINGFCAIIFEDEKVAVTFEVKTGQVRSVSEPTGEKILKGAKDGFVETLRVNTALIRRKIKNPDLKIKQTVVGRQTLTSVAVVYVSGLTNMEMVEELEKRLDAIDIDGLMSTGNLEDYIVDNKKSPLPQLIYTERSDKFCINILEGRVGIIIDGLPTGYLLPGTFAQFMKAPEDYTEHFIVGSAITLLRYICLLISLFLPAIYVAIAMYHQEMIPTQLMQSIIDSKQHVPFDTSIEVLGMLLAFELLQEAAVRLPTAVGETLGMIGALIVGQSAVEAEIISPMVVIVVALAGIAGYTVTNLNLASTLRYCRLLLVFAALLGGMYGIAVAAVLLVYHLGSLESFGVSYLTPFTGGGLKAIGQAVFRWPLPKAKLREDALRAQNKRNQG